MYQITFKSNGVTRMTTTKAYDYLNRLTSISSSSSFSSSFNYGYNNANQRTSVTNADKSRWVYGYDSLGQVTSGKKYWKDGTVVAGQQFEYSFDDIGNRTQTKSGDDATGANLRQADYTANSLNQYTSRGVPGYVDIFGVSFATNTVTVNGDSTYRKWEYFRNERQVNNSSNIWTNIVVAATGQTSVTGNVLVVQSPEAFTYDADGNLTSDGAWTNTWNAENRLIATECRTNVPTAARMKEEWTYLPDGRWSQRIVSTNNGTSWVAVLTNRFLWDGKVLLAILDHTNGLVMSFMRGLDLSGTMQGAGGVGGVLAVSFKTTGVHFAAFDGNGNVAALANAANGTTGAQYEYGPFGETVRVTGPVAKQNPIRFSTQYADDVTGDLKYLYREYSPSTGRWLSRDPIGEQGGKRLCGFVANDPVGAFDPYGFASEDADSAEKQCQTLINARSGNDPNWVTVTLSTPAGSGDCLKTFESLTQHPIVQPLWKQFNQTNCRAPVFDCQECSCQVYRPDIHRVYQIGGQFIYDPTTGRRTIKICWNNIKTFKDVYPDDTSLAKLLAHETTHALQKCPPGKFQQENCKDSLKREIEARKCGKQCEKFNECLALALDSSCGRSCMKASEVSAVYAELNKWFEETDAKGSKPGGFCTFNITPSQPTPKRKGVGQWY